MDGVLELDLPSVAQGRSDARSDAPGREHVTPTQLAANRAMDRYADGDDDAFSTVYDALAPRLYAFLQRQTRDPAATEDILQQTLLQMHCARSSFARGAEVIPWGFAIARRLVIDAYRRGRYAEVQLDADADDDERASPDASPDEVLQSKQTARRIERALMKLPESQRIVFQLVRQEGLSLAEAAAVLGTTPNAVKVRSHRASDAIRLALTREAGER